MIARDDLLAQEPASIYRRIIVTGIDAGVWTCVSYVGVYEALPAVHRFVNDDAAFIASSMFYLCMPAYFFTEVVGRRTLGKLCAGIMVAGSAGGKARWPRWTRWAIRSSPC